MYIRDWCLKNLLSASLMNYHDAFQTSKLHESMKYLTPEPWQTLRWRALGTIQFFANWKFFQRNISSVKDLGEVWALRTTPTLEWPNKEYNCLHTRHNRICFIDILLLIHECVLTIIKKKKLLHGVERERFTHIKRNISSLQTVLSKGNPRWGHEKSARLCYYLSRNFKYEKFIPFYSALIQSIGLRYPWFNSSSPCTLWEKLLLIWWLTINCQS